MALPSLVKTWQFASRTYRTTGTGVSPGAADHAALMFDLKSLLTGFASNPWLVGYSCDGTTAGTPGDGVDRWLTAANLVWGSGAFSWIVLRNPSVASNAQLLIALNSSGADRATISFSVNAGFTGGSTSLRPTASDEVPLKGTGELWQAFAGGSASTRFDYILHAWHAVDGQATRIVGIQPGILEGSAPSASPGQEPALWIEVSRVVDPPTSWPQPVIFFWAGNSGEARMRFSDFNSPSSAVVRGYGLGEASAVSFYLTAPHVAVDAIGETLDSEIMLDGEWLLGAIGVASQNLRRRGHHGYLVDAWWGSVMRQTGDTFPVNGRQFLQLGQIVLPWNGSAPVVSL